MRASHEHMRNSLDPSMPSYSLARTFRSSTRRLRRFSAPNVHRIDPAVVQAERATDFAHANESGTTRFVTTGDAQKFAASAATILGRSFRIDDVVHRSLVVVSGA